MKIIEKRVLFFDAKRIIRSWQFLISIVVIIVSSIITYNRNYYLMNLMNMKTIGGLNRFIYACIYNNLIMNMIAPIIAALTTSSLIIEEITSGVSRQLAVRIGYKKYFKSKAFSSALYGGLVFAIAYTLVFVGCMIIDPNASIRTDYYRHVLFGSIYDYSMLCYCFCFIMYSFVVGATYSMFACGFEFLTKNHFIAISCPFFINYISSFLIDQFPVEMSQSLKYFLPRMTFDISQHIESPFQLINQVLLILIVGTGMFIIGAKRLYKQTQI